MNNLWFLRLGGWMYSVGFLVCFVLIVLVWWLRCVDAGLRMNSIICVSHDSGVYAIYNNYYYYYL